MLEAGRQGGEARRHAGSPAAWGIVATGCARAVGADVIAKGRREKSGSREWRGGRGRGGVRRREVQWTGVVTI